MVVGHDLKAIDIQRCRDYGIAPYNDYRVLCKLPRAEKFSDFSDVIRSEVRYIYKLTKQNKLFKKNLHPHKGETTFLI